MTQSWKIPAYLLGGVTALLTTTSSIALFTEWPYLKYLEVYFYDSSSNSSTSPERIRLWVEELGNFSKAQYFKKTSVSQASTDSQEGTWEYLNSQDDQGTDYRKLAVLARQFIETQHYLNVARATHTSNNWISASTTGGTTSTELKAKCSDCCKKSGETCTCKSCLCCFSNDTQCCKSGQTDCKIANLKKQQNQFAYYLSNLHSPFNNAYLSPVQAHIKLLDASFASDLKVAQSTGSSSSSSTSSKNMVGTLVYGFVDYYYKETNVPKNNDMRTQISTTLSIDSSSSSPEEKKYFYNVPQQFTFNLNFEDTGGTQKKTISDIWRTFNKDASKEVKSLSAKLKDAKEVECCCCKDNENIMDCLVKRNFVVEDTDLGKIQSKIKDSTACCTALAA